MWGAEAVGGAIHITPVRGPGNADFSQCRHRMSLHFANTVKRDHVQLSALPGTIVRVRSKLKGSNTVQTYFLERLL